MATNDDVGDLAAEVLDHIQCSHAALDAAKAQLDKQAADQKAEATKKAELIPKAVQALIEHRRIGPERAKMAEELLADPVKALEILINVADPGQTTDPRALGRPQEKAASDASKITKRAGYVGERQDETSESWQRFKEILLGG